MTSLNENPWRLNAKEAEMMDAMTKHGFAKLIARELECSPHTVHERIKTARKKMGGKHSIVMAVEWAAWRALGYSPIAQHAKTPKITA